MKLTDDRIVERVWQDYVDALCDRVGRFRVPYGLEGGERIGLK